MKQQQCLAAPGATLHHKNIINVYLYYFSSVQLLRRTLLKPLFDDKEEYYPYMNNSTTMHTEKSELFRSKMQKYLWKKRAARLVSPASHSSQATSFQGLPVQ